MKSFLTYFGFGSLVGFLAPLGLLADVVTSDPTTSAITALGGSAALSGVLFWLLRTQGQTFHDDLVAERTLREHQLDEINKSLRDLHLDLVAKGSAPFHNDPPKAP
jgi:hypothetical protein